MSHKYKQLSGEFEQRREDYLLQHPEMAHKGGVASEDSKLDWEKELQMEQNMRLVGDMQVALQREIQSVTICLYNITWRVCVFRWKDLKKKKKIF